MLSPLQERVARIVATVAEAESFALAGGAALIVRGDVDRRTRAAFPLDDVRLEQLQVAVDTWKSRALAHAEEQELIRSLRHEQDRDIGLGR